jgi:predicted ATP-dependent Lon-type protease
LIYRFFFFTISASVRWCQDFLHDGLHHDFETDMLSSQHTHEKYYHLFEPLPDFLQVIAFLDRIHAYLPGWELPKLSPDSYAKDYGFITDYFCEI